MVRPAGERLAALEQKSDDTLRRVENIERGQRDTNEALQRIEAVLLERRIGQRAKSHFLDVVKMGAAGVTGALMTHLWGPR